MEVLKTYLPTSIVDLYVESTDAYTKLTTDEERQQLKKEEEEKFLTYVLLRRSNQQIFGSLLKKWSAEFAQGRDQYPIGLEEAKDVMAQHMLSNSDAVTKQKLMNKLKSKGGDQGERQLDVNSESNSQQETSFAQNDNKFCYCCGSKDHLSFDCSKKDKVPRDQWYVNKMHSHAQQLISTDDQQLNEDAGSKSGMRLQCTDCLVQRKNIAKQSSDSREN